MISIDELTMHPIAMLNPLRSDDEQDALTELVGGHGFDSRKPIVLLDGMILDGWGRYQAALAAGVLPEFVDYAGEYGSPLAFILAEHTRRNTTPSQRAMQAAMLLCVSRGIIPLALAALTERDVTTITCFVAQITEAAHGGEVAGVLARKLGVNRDYVYQAYKLLIQPKSGAAADSVAAGAQSITSALATLADMEANVTPRGLKVPADKVWVWDKAIDETAGRYKITKGEAAVMMAEYWLDRMLGG